MRIVLSVQYVCKIIFFSEFSVIPKKVSHKCNTGDKVENVSANKKKVIVVKPYTKRRIVRSQTQALKSTNQRYD